MSSKGGDAKERKESKEESKNAKDAKARGGSTAEAFQKLEADTELADLGLISEKRQKEAEAAEKENPIGFAFDNLLAALKNLSVIEGVPQKVGEFAKNLVDTMMGKNLPAWQTTELIQSLHNSQYPEVTDATDLFYYNCLKFERLLTKQYQESKFIGDKKMESATNTVFRWVVRYTDLYKMLRDKTELGEFIAAKNKSLTERGLPALDKNYAGGSLEEDFRALRAAGILPPQSDEKAHPPEAKEAVGAVGDAKESKAEAMRAH